MNNAEWEAIVAKIEPAATATAPAMAMETSIAISLKRIADAMTAPQVIVEQGDADFGEQYRKLEQHRAAMKEGKADQ